MITGDQIAIGALFVSFVSMAIAWRSYVVSGKAFLLNKKEHDEKYHEIISYLIEGIKWKDGDDYFCSFALSYTNQATISNSLKQIDLEIDYYDVEGKFNKAKISPEMGMSPIGLSGSYKQMEVPLYLKEKETASGWLTFKLPSNSSHIDKIDAYRVCALTPTEDKVSVSTYLLRAAYNGKR